MSYSVCFNVQRLVLVFVSLKTIHQHERQDANSPIKRIVLWKRQESNLLPLSFAFIAHQYATIAPHSQKAEQYVYCS
jgi:hypothetical protein